MHSSAPTSVMLVLSLPPMVDAASAGCEISALPGVTRVTADPERRQLVVRYEPDAVTASEIRACLLAEGHAAGLPAALLAAWLLVAELLPIGVALL